jgi:hypothetical protein
MINEHDETKGMLSIIREFQNAPSLDVNEPATKTDDSIKLEGSERDEEIGKLKQAVASRIKIDDETPIIYPMDDNIILRGEFEGLRFEMSLNDGLFITTSSLKINDNEMVELIKKLDGYYAVWRDEWPDRLPDYKKNS